MAIFFGHVGYMYGVISFDTYFMCQNVYTCTTTVQY